MTHIEKQADANRFLEGGMFYPTGRIVAAFPSQADAEDAVRALAARGIGPDAVQSIDALTMHREARENLDQAIPYLTLGAALPVREKQLELAEQGCHFLLIAADTDRDTQTAMQALSQARIRYAVKYNRLTIDNLVRDIPSATGDREAARVL